MCVCVMCVCAVCETHLSVPTLYSLYVSVVDVSFKNVYGRDLIVSYDILLLALAPVRQSIAKNVVNGMRPCV